MTWLPVPVMTAWRVFTVRPAPLLAVLAVAVHGVAGRAGSARMAVFGAGRGQRVAVGGVFLRLPPLDS